MPDNADEIERDALDMIRQYGDSAVRIARLRVEIAEENIRNPRSGSNLARYRRCD